MARAQAGQANVFDPFPVVSIGCTLKLSQLSCIQSITACMAFKRARFLPKLVRIKQTL